MATDSRMRRAWRSVAVAALVLLYTSATSISDHVSAGLEDDLLRLQETDDASAVQQLAQRALDRTSSPDAATAALVELGDLFFYGNATLGTRANGLLAMRFYAKAADAGNAHAQFHVGVAQSYGLWGVARDEPAALVNYYFASLGNNTAATLALGHKHLLGGGVPKNCESAVRYYEVAANRAVALREADPSKPAIYDLPHRRLKTVAETQHKKNIPSDAAIVDYYEFSADKGDPEATMNLATLYYYGARGLTQDLERAAALFHRAYDLGASGSAYHLGHIYSHGIGVAQNNATAFTYLQEASNDGNTQALNELAYMHLHGRGTAQDVRQATTLFQNAAKQGNMEAFYNLGVLHMQGGVSLSPSASVSSSPKRRAPEYEVAHGYFQVAAHQGHTISSHRLGHMSLHGIGTTRSCKNAVDAFKLVAERGPWDRLLARAFTDFKNQDYDAAFIKYAVMAQQGYEVAQHNAAYLLDYGYLTPLFSNLLLDIDSSDTSVVDPETAASVAMSLYKLAALQGNVDANLKIGDFYYYGKGDKAVDYARASAHYSLASKRANAQAMFNLAYMYEHGIGVDQDFYLAKRFFDKARDAHSDAHVPVTLALWKLHVHTWWASWQRAYDILVGNIEAPAPAPVVINEDATSFVDKLLETLWPGARASADANAPASPSTGATEATSQTSISTAGGDAQTSTWRDVVHQLLESDDVLILLLMFALGVVLYIRSERQYLGDPMPPPRQQEQQEQQEPVEQQ